MNTIISEKKNTVKKPKPKEELQRLEKLLKEVFKKKKEIERNFSNKFKELEKQSKENQKWFDEEWQRLEKLENQLILWWDFWKREIEISHLRGQATIGTLPSEQKKIDEQIEILNAYNIKLEKSFKGGKIDAEIIIKLRRELEEWMEKKE